MPVFASTIFLSAFLLFLVQPIIAKQILPWFGGTPAVWNTCMLFFQMLLLAGYAYSDWSIAKLKPRAQAILHCVLLGVSLISLPILADAGWKPQGDEDPVWRILALLGATIGLPYFLLSSTGPLIQACFARRYGGERVYRLFALSNFGSLLALLAFPFAIEMLVSTHGQAIAWSVGYGVFVLVCGASVMLSAGAMPSGAMAEEVAKEGVPPTLAEQGLWLTLAALGTIMLLAVTNHITQNIASIPLLWLAPLTLYLLSFILCFEGRGWYRRWLFVLPFLALLPAMAWGLQANSGVLEIKKAIPLYCLGLFVSCMFFHGELALAKPAPRYLTRFYLMVSLGGAVGGLIVGVIAPRIFAAYYELPVALVVGGLIAAYLLFRPGVSGGVLESLLDALLKRGRLAAAVLARSLTLGVALAATGITGWYVYQYQHEYLADTTILMQRNFFGMLRVQESGVGAERVRNLVHGVIMHGKQSFDPAFQKAPTTYYTEDSGVGRAFAAFANAPLRAGVIGLGVGTLATYGRKGDVLRFYDINPQVIEVARKEFTYLSDSAAKIETVLGDARLAMEREPAQQYDVLVVDAFSSDAIPVHLITLEAMDTYLKHMKPGGVIAFHVTNRYLNLKPVVKLLAQARGLRAMNIADDGEARFGSSTDWVLVARDPAFFKSEAMAGVVEEIDIPADLPTWTDDFNNLIQVLK
ncbi:MAG: spermidine synthase [Burkholderiales bacterium]